MTDFFYLLACVGGAVLAFAGVVWAYRAAMYGGALALLWVVPLAAFGLWMLSWAVPAYLGT